MNVDGDTGQPHPRLHFGNRQRRTIAEMLGLAKGIIADCEVTRAEVAFLRDWVTANPEAMETWPCSVLADRLMRIYADGVVSEEERSDLHELLLDVTGGALDQVEMANPTTSLPLNHPAPAIDFDGRHFVFTGRFIFGPRKACEQCVVDAGGSVGSSVTLKTNYVVIGDLGSRDWIHTSFGTKIRKAVEYRDVKGAPLAIVHEEHWASHLGRS